MNGKVYLVGAGPGDPELLTVKALRLLAQADVVLHDELVSQEVLVCARPGARIQSVGKRCGPKTIRQEEIASLMVAYARQGHLVIRLKGGDPLVFGRAGEEMEALRQANIQFEVVPGITSALSAAAEAQIPLTDRRLASTLVFVSNHQCCEKNVADWTHLVSRTLTIAVYMPGSDYRGLARRMIAAGLNSQTPCVVISHASQERQKVHRTDLAGLMDVPVHAAPALVIIGEVAGGESRSAAGDAYFEPTDATAEALQE